jgi:hypothetical protein
MGNRSQPVDVPKWAEVSNINTGLIRSLYIYSTLMADGRQIIPILADQFAEHIVTNQGYHTPSFPRHIIFYF